jgi:hypothetical protein
VTHALLLLPVGEALQHLATWLNQHKEYGSVAHQFGPPPDSSQMLSHVVGWFCFAVMFNIVLPCTVMFTMTVSLRQKHELPRKRAHVGCTKI